MNNHFPFLVGNSHLNSFKRNALGFFSTSCSWHVPSLSYFWRPAWWVAGIGRDKHVAVVPGDGRNLAASVTGKKSASGAEHRGCRHISDYVPAATVTHSRIRSA